MHIAAQRAAAANLDLLCFCVVISILFAYKFYWKQPAETTSSFSPRNLATFLKPGAVAPGWKELLVSVVMVVSSSTKLILIYILA